MPNSLAARTLWIVRLLPLWWLLGVEQFIVPVYVLGEFIVAFLPGAGREPYTVPPFVFWAGLFALWALLPAYRAPNTPVYLKSTSTLFSHAMLLFLWVNCISDPADWRRLRAGLLTLAAYTALGGVLAALGLRGEITSAVGWVIGTDSPSEFFSTITTRNLVVDSGRLPVLPDYRVTAFFLKPTDLSSALPFLFAVAATARNRVRLPLIATLLLCLLLAGVRTAFVGVLIGLGLAVVWWLGLFRGRERLLLGVGAATVGAAVLVLVYLLFPALNTAFDRAFVETRTGSYTVRTAIYDETLRLLPTYPLSGWGVSTRISGLPSTFSAGSHSDYLSVLFRQGIVGLLLYLLAWGTLWRRAVAGLGRALPDVVRRQHALLICALVAFAFQIAFSDWRWDQTTVLSVWLALGLLLAPVEWTGALMHHHKAACRSEPHDG